MERNQSQAESAVEDSSCWAFLSGLCSSRRVNRLTAWKAVMLMTSRRILIALLFACVSAPASAQWLNVRSAGIPRLPDGKPDLSAPAPRDADGKPMISGLWMPDRRYIGDIARDLKEVPFQPWARELYAQRRANNSKDDPTGHCMVGGVPR